jgi:hypothetical protein
MQYEIVNNDNAVKIKELGILEKQKIQQEEQIR